MLRLLSIGIDVISAAAILVPLLILLQHFFCGSMSWQRRSAAILFSLYLAAVFSAVGTPAANSLTVDLSLNLIPLIDVVHSPLSYLKNSVLNMALFLPLGFLTPLMWKAFRGLRETALLGLGVSLFVELSQIFTYRLTDVDDLLMNTLGTMIGWFMASCFLEKKECVSTICGECSEDRIGYFEQTEQADRIRGVGELVFLFAVVLLAKFTLIPLVAGAIWTVIL